MNVNGTVVIIGGSSGIGLAVARRSLADRATVVIAGRSQERLGAARAELARTGPAAGRLVTFPADIGDLAQVTRLFDRVGALSHLVVTAADPRAASVAPGTSRTPSRSCSRTTS